MAIDLKELQTEDLNQESEASEQQEPSQEAKETKEQPTSQGTKGKSLKGTIIGCTGATCATALCIGFIPKDCASTNTQLPLLQQVQEENESLRQQNQILQASRKRREKELQSARTNQVQDEDLKQLKDEAQKAERLSTQLQEEQQYSEGLKTQLEEAKKLLQKIKEGRQKNKETGQSRFDYKTWLELFLKENAELLNSSLPIAGFQIQARNPLPGLEGERYQAPSGIKGSRLTPLGGEEGQYVNAYNDGQGSLWVLPSELTPGMPTSAQLGQISRILELLIKLDDTSLKDQRHQYKNRQELLDGVETWLTGFIQVQEEMIKRNGQQ